jgi:hypothetical protein
LFPVDPRAWASHAHELEFRGLHKEDLVKISKKSMVVKGKVSSLDTQNTFNFKIQDTTTRYLKIQETFHGVS